MASAVTIPSYEILRFEEMASQQIEKEFFLNKTFSSSGEEAKKHLEHFKHILKLQTSFSKRLFLSFALCTLPINSSDLFSKDLSKPSRFLSRAAE